MPKCCKYSIVFLFAFFTLSYSYDYLTYSSKFIGSDYQQALSMSVKFFGGQRCGNTHNWMLYDNPNTGKVCHTKDAYLGRDMTGGWHDCGDHIKVATTMGYAAVCLLVAYDVWPKAFGDSYDSIYGPPNGIPDVLDEAKIATDYFIKSLPDDNTFVYYLANGDYDHKVWCTSSFQSGLSVDQGGDPRPSAASTTAGGPQAMTYSAALSLMALHYPDPTYATKCKEYAIKLYNYSKTRTANITIPSFYAGPNSEYSDEYSLASMLLYRLTKESSYKTQALSYMQGKWESNAPLAWDTFADINYYYILLEDPNASNGSGGYIREFIRKNVYTLGITSGKTSQVGYPYFQNKWGTNKLACGSAFAAVLLCDLVKKGKLTLDVAEAAKYDRRVVDYMLGENEFSHTFIHGYKGDKTFKIHHRNAMGINTNPPDAVKETTPYLFASGGLIGGPQGYNQFNNSVVDYVCTEGGCDYNGPFVGAIAGLVAELAPIGIRFLPDFQRQAQGSEAFSSGKSEMVRFDIQGKKVDYTLSRNQSSAIYFVALRDEKGVSVEKWLIKKSK